MSTLVIWGGRCIHPLYTPLLARDALQLHVGKNNY